MKLCVASCKPVWRSPDAESGYATDGGFPFQMAAISSLFDQTDLIVCERPAPLDTPGTPLPQHGVRVVPLREPGGTDATCPEYVSKARYRYALEQPAGSASPSGALGACAA